MATLLVHGSYHWHYTWLKWWLKNCKITFEKGLVHAFFLFLAHSRNNFEILNFLDTSAFLRSKWVKKSNVEEILKRFKIKNFQQISGGKKNRISAIIREILEIIWILFYFLKTLKRGTLTKFLSTLLQSLTGHCAKTRSSFELLCPLLMTRQNFFIFEI